MICNAIRLCTVIGIAVFVGSPPASAQLDLELLDSPDLISGFLSLSYDSAGDLLTADGFALAFDDDGVGPVLEITDGIFELDAVIDFAGVLSSGSLQIGGTIPGLGFLSGTLLTGNIVDFGFEAAADAPFEFLINLTGGDVATLFPSDPVGLILTQSGFPGGFASDFDNLDGGLPGTGNGIADLAPVVPMPGSGVLALVGAGLIGVARRRHGST